MDFAQLFLLVLLIAFLTAGFLTLILLAGAVLLHVLLEIRALWRRQVVAFWQQMRSHLKNVGTSGYLPAPPSQRALTLLKVGAKSLGWLQVGRVAVQGTDNLAVDGPVIYIANHVYYADAMLVTSLFPYPVRYMAATEVMRFAGGLLGLLCSYFGAFAVDRRPGHGATGRKAAIEVLVSGQKLGMFPEGWCSLDGKMAPFRKGAVRVAKDAAKQLGSSVQIVPIHISYGRYPGAWGKRLGSNLAYFWVFFFFWYYRQGATVVIGKPISSDALPKDESTATQMLYDRVSELAPMR